jgi:hypothetical protein
MSFIVSIASGGRSKSELNGCVVVTNIRLKPNKRQFNLFLNPFRVSNNANGKK